MQKRFHSSSQSTASQCPCFSTLTYNRHVIANDLSPTAADAMRRNVELNGLAEPDTSQKEQEKNIPAYVKVNEGDAWYLSFLCRFLSNSHVAFPKCLDVQSSNGEGPSGRRRSRSVWVCCTIYRRIHSVHQGWRCSFHFNQPVPFIS